jgi:small subunit ribosomal protein S5
MKPRQRRPGSEPEEDTGLERVVKINRVAAVVKGGRRFSFSAAVVVGDGEGKVGLGYGKAREVPAAVEKAMKDGRNTMARVSLTGEGASYRTIPYQVVGRFGASRVILVPASAGTGVIAGAPVRAVVECAGITDILTKSIGNNNAMNVVKATMNGLQQLHTKEELEKLRGVTIELE